MVVSSGAVVQAYGEGGEEDGDVAPLDECPVFDVVSEKMKKKKGKKRVRGYRWLASQPFGSTRTGPTSVRKYSGSGTPGGSCWVRRRCAWAYLEVEKAGKRERRREDGAVEVVVLSWLSGGSFWLLDSAFIERDSPFWTPEILVPMDFREGESLTGEPTAAMNGDFDFEPIKLPTAISSSACLAFFSCSSSKACSGSRRISVSIRLIQKGKALMWSSNRDATP